MIEINNLPQDIQKIINLGYDVKKCTDWHYQVFHDYTLTNIWVTTKKYMKDRCKSESYSNIQEVIDTLGKKTMDEETIRFVYNKVKI
jgi:hypothetical protein